MAFQLKSMDVFEKVDKGGKFYLRLVDAKFALPVEERKGEGKLEKAEGRQQGWAGQKRRFVCLDVVEYPGEHDDVTIGFDTQTGTFSPPPPPSSLSPPSLTPIHGPEPGANLGR